MSYKTYYYPLTIKENHLDTFGHVNNATYLDLFEEARWEVITENGYGIDKIKKSGLGPVVLEITIRYTKELCLREKVVIETQLLSYNKKIGRLSQILKRGDEVCCTAEIVLALFDLNARKIVPPTPEWLFAVSGNAD